MYIRRYGKSCSSLHLVQTKPFLLWSDSGILHIRERDRDKERYRERVRGRQREIEKMNEKVHERKGMYHPTMKSRRIIKDFFPFDGGSRAFYLHNCTTPEQGVCVCGGGGENSTESLHNYFLLRLSTFCPNSELQSHLPKP